MLYVNVILEKFQCKKLFFLDQNKQILLILKNKKSKFLESTIRELHVYYS